MPPRDCLTGAGHAESSLRYRVEPSSARLRTQRSTLRRRPGIRRTLARLTQIDEGGDIITRQDVVAALEAAGAEYNIVEHAPALTTAEADAAIEGYDGVRTKSLFLVNRKRTASYLLIMDDAKPLDLAALATVLDESRLSIGSPDRLRKALDVEPGIVSPFAMLDTERRGPTLLWDREMLMDPVLTFHPGENTATVFVGTQDMRDLLTQAGVEQRVIDAPAPASSAHA